MAESEHSRGKEPLPRKQDPTFSHSPDASEDDAPKAVPAGLRRPAAKSKSKKGSWFERNQTVVISSAVVAGVLVIVLVVGWAFGWIGGGSKAKSAATVPQAVAAAPPAAPKSSPAVPPPQSAQPSVPAGQPAPQDVKKDEPKKEQKPPLPDDVAKWDTEAYHRARRENDPKLLVAVARLGETHPGNSRAAQCLMDLLKPLPPEKPPAEPPPSLPQQAPNPKAPPNAARSVPALSASPQLPRMNPNIPGGRPYNPADLAKLVETIVEALGCNGSEVARGTLEQVLAGTFATDDDKAAVEATLKTLVAHPSEENDALLLRAMTDAKTLRAADHEGAWPAKELQTKAFELVKQSASSELRTKLARAAIGSHATFNPKDPANEFLLAANPSNCGAQLAIYESGNPTKELKATLEQQFVGYSSKAMARYLGVSDTSQPGAVGLSPVMRPSNVGGGIPRPGEPVKPAEIDLGPQLAEQLWSDGFRNSLESQLSTTRALDKQSQLVLLAATIPQDSTRVLLSKLLVKRQYDGPKALESAGLIDRTVTDPGLLVTVKMLHRTESPSTPRASDIAGARRGRGAAAGAPSGRKVNEALQKKQEAERDWMDASAKLVSGWCKRFDAAESDKPVGAAASDKPVGEGAEGKLPAGFELPAGAKVVASHRVVLPDAAPAGFSKVQPDTLEVYYVRAEESSKLKNAITYYSRQARARITDARTIDKKIWIDTVRPGSQKDRRRSVDVLITHPEPIVPTAKDKEKNNEDEVDLTIEILIVEIKVPTKES